MKMITTNIRSAIHISWDKLQEIGIQKMIDMIGRNISVKSDRQEFYHWGFNISHTPLTREEIDRIFEIVGASEFDRESNDFGEYPIMEINQGLAEKMVASEIPFLVSSSHADGDGVWFFGPNEDNQVNIMVTYPETEMNPDVFKVIPNSGVSVKKLQSCFESAIKALSTEEETDKLSLIDNVFDKVSKKKNGIQNHMLVPVAFEIEIN